MYNAYDGFNMAYINKNLYVTRHGNTLMKSEETEAGDYSEEQGQLGLLHIEFHNN